MQTNLRRALLVLALALPSTARASASVDLSLSEGPASLELSFRSEPEVVQIPEHRVWVVRDPRCDDDVFRYAGAWWVAREGRWYRSRTWRGPFAHVHERYVPASLWRVPAKHWRRHPGEMAPGRLRKGPVVKPSDRREVVVDREKPGRGKREGDDRRD